MCCSLKIFSDALKPFDLYVVFSTKIEDLNMVVSTCTLSRFSC